MIVISDASPLHYLVQVGAVEVLPVLFSEILVPPKVLEELQHVRTPDDVRAWARQTPAWLRIRQASVALSFQSRLDAGEAEALSLAHEVHAAAVLIDERKGTRAAKSLGIQPIGTLTLLELAAERKLVDLLEMLGRLRETNFRISRKLLAAVEARELARRQGRV